MSNDLFATPEYQELIATHLNQTMEFLFKHSQEFALACDTRHLLFQPELPDEIKNSFGETVLFIISGYTYDTAQLNDNSFSFEAGFGDENFGSLVTLPILSIRQVFVGEYPIALNISEQTQERSDGPSSKDASIKSMEALLSNPENKKLLQKKKV
jgi:hypothetical protein